MSRIATVIHETAEGKAKELLDGVKKQIGFAPNMMKTMAQSPAVLEAYLNFNKTLGSALNSKLREQIALVSAEENGCGYCASAHTAIGKMVGLDEAEILAARDGKSDEAKTEAALTFSKIVLQKRGKVSDGDLETIKNAGFTAGEIAEIVANVVLNIFTNYFNEIAQTEIDFPVVEIPLKRKATA